MKVSRPLNPSQNSTSLQPSDTVQRALLSSTSRFIGEYDHGEVLLAHAWPDFTRPRHYLQMTGGPGVRNAFILSFRTEPLDLKAGVVIPDYSPVADRFAAYLGVLFGKRFDHHGLIESTGLFRLPDLSEMGTLSDPTSCLNSHSPRVDYPIPLDLREVSRLHPIIEGDSLSSSFVQTFSTAAKFYLGALQKAERDPEIAYLHLITVGEILSNSYSFKKTLLFDSRTQEVLQKLREGLPDGDRIAKFFISQMPLIRRRFLRTVERLIDDSFFERSEAKIEFARLRRDDFSARVKAAYDLRSRYVHTGIPFGGWVSTRSAAGPNSPWQK